MAFTMDATFIYYIASVLGCREVNTRFNRVFAVAQPNFAVNFSCFVSVCLCLAGLQQFSQSDLYGLANILAGPSLIIHCSTV